MAYKRHVRQLQRRVLKRISTYAANKALRRIERILKAQEQQQEYDALRLMTLEEAMTRRADYLWDVTNFVCMEIVHGRIVHEALRWLDRKEEERRAAERMRDDKRRLHQELCLIVEFDIIRRCLLPHVWDALDSRAAAGQSNLCKMQQEIDLDNQRPPSESKEAGISIETSRDKYAYKREKTAVVQFSNGTGTKDVDDSSVYLNLSEYISKHTMESCDNAFHRYDDTSNDDMDGDIDKAAAVHKYKAEHKPVTFLRSRFEEEFIAVTNSLYNQSRSAPVTIITLPPTSSSSSSSQLIQRSHSSHGHSRAKRHEDGSSCKRSQSANMRHTAPILRGFPNSISCTDHSNTRAAPCIDHSRGAPCIDHSRGAPCIDHSRAGDSLFIDRNVLDSNWDSILPHHHISNDRYVYPTTYAATPLPIDMILHIQSDHTGGSPRSKQPTVPSKEIRLSSNANTASSIDNSFHIHRYQQHNHKQLHHHQHHSKSKSKRSGYCSYDFDQLRGEKLTPAGIKIIHNSDLEDRSRDLVSIHHAPSSMLSVITDRHHHLDHHHHHDHDDNVGSSLEVGDNDYDLKITSSKKMTRRTKTK